MQTHSPLLQALNTVTQTPIPPSDYDKLISSTKPKQSQSARVNPHQQYQRCPQSTVCTVNNRPSGDQQQQPKSLSPSTASLMCQNTHQKKKKITKSQNCITDVSKSPKLYHSPLPNTPSAQFPHNSTTGTKLAPSHQPKCYASYHTHEHIHVSKSFNLYHCMNTTSALNATVSTQMHHYNQVNTKPSAKCHA